MNFVLKSALIVTTLGEYSLYSNLRLDLLFRHKVNFLNNVVPEVNLTNTKLNPEEVEALAKVVVKKKRSVGFTEEKEPLEPLEPETKSQKLIVEIDDEIESSPNKKRKSKKKKKKNLVSQNV